MGVKKKIWKNPFVKTAEWMYDHVFSGRTQSRKYQSLSLELEELEPGQKNLLREFYVRKIAAVMLMLVLLCAAGGAFMLSGIGRSRTVENRELRRPDYGEGTREELLTVEIEGESEAEELAVAVGERRYTALQAQGLLKRCMKELDQMILNKNKSPDEIRTALQLPSSLEAGSVGIEWTMIPYGVIDADGSIVGEPDEKGTLVELLAVLHCQEEEMTYELAVNVFPPLLTEEEAFHTALKKAIDEGDKKSSSKQTMELPGEVNGKKINWMYGETRSSLLMLICLSGICPLVYWIKKDRQIHEQAEQRKIQLVMDYPELMWKLSMLLGAGITIRSAFMRIAGEYQRSRKEDKKAEIRYVYEEILLTCRELNYGTMESEAYEQFGKRCGLPRYIKLGTMLSQNLRKGSKGLTAALEQEAVSSMEERKGAARKMGEQAGTKLMFPMLLMFGVVLAVLIVPAVMTF